MIAAESENTQMVKFLLKCGLDINYGNEVKGKASEIALTEEKFETLLEILKADGPFPSEFDVESLPSGHLHAIKLKLFVEQRNSFHENIKANKIEEVQKFLTDNSLVKCAYNSVNRCALSTALQFKSFEIYAFLRSNGFSCGVDFDRHQKYLWNLSFLERQQMRKSNRNYFKETDNAHIMDLLSKSRLGFGSEQIHFEKIKTYFEALDKIPEIQPILKTVANSKFADIIFDFNCGSVEDMDPSRYHFNEKGEISGVRYKLSQAGSHLHWSKTE